MIKYYQLSTHSKANGRKSNEEGKSYCMPMLYSPVDFLYAESLDLGKEIPQNKILCTYAYKWSIDFDLHLKVKTDIIQVSSFGSMLAISENMKNVFINFGLKNIKFIPLECIDDGKTVGYAVQSSDILDCLDIKKSGSYKLKEEVIASYDLFKFDFFPVWKIIRGEEKHSYCWCISERLYNAMKEAKLKGLELYPEVVAPSSIKIESEGSIKVNFKFLSWTDNMLEQVTKEKVFKDINAFYFCLEENVTGYSCTLYGCGEYMPDNDDWACPEYVLTGKENFKINFRIAGQEWLDALEYFRSSLKEYLMIGKYREILQQKKAVALGFSDGDLYIEYENY